ncbi:MAG: hypothetical protein IPG33_10440 [Betaproteobacteria bacterium]|jgi:hypothetical protein|nr:hypothetical protein [Betaproteobacteria bacterium]
MNRFMQIFLTILLAAPLAIQAAPPTGGAAANALLIQLRPDGSFKVWHGAGASLLPSDEIYDLEASARPEGGDIQPTTLGRAQAFETKQGVVIELPDAQSDKRLLLDRDPCGGLKVWHDEGTTRLPDDVLTELVLTALPDGGARIKIGENVVRGYTVERGVIAVIWKPSRRTPRPEAKP